MKAIQEFYGVPYRHIESINECLIGSDYQLAFENGKLYEIDLQMTTTIDEYYKTEIDLLEIVIIVKEWIMDWLERSEFTEEEIKDLIDATNYIIEGVLLIDKSNKNICKW